MPKYNLESDETIKLWYQSRLSLKIETNVIIFIKQKQNKNILIFWKSKKQTNERKRKEKKTKKKGKKNNFILSLFIPPNSNQSLSLIS